MMVDLLFVSLRLCCHIGKAPPGLSTYLEVVAYRQRLYEGHHGLGSDCGYAIEEQKRFDRLLRVVYFINVSL